VWRSTQSNSLLNAIKDVRTNPSHNAAPLLTVEALMCVLAR